uniref:CorC_HlyC domain-containing protein n=1 Tax=Heterorhabditis bacteriophora TaxID=37862 RepID=A0A1I7WC38_HETBA
MEAQMLGAARVITDRLELWGQPWQEKETLFCFEIVRLDGRRQYTGRVVAINLNTNVVSKIN